MRVVFVVVAAALSAMWTARASNLTNALAAILASDNYCQLTYSEDAIRDYIIKNVKPNDTEFLSDLHFSRQSEEYSHEKMSQSEKIVYCTHVRQMAEYLGFLK